MSASFASGARVVVTSADHVIPKGTRGTVTKVYGSKVGVQWDNGMETDFPADALAIVAETPEETGNRAPTVDEQFLRLKAEFDARDAAQNPANQLREAMEAAGRIGVVFPTDAGVPGKHPALDGEAVPGQ